MRQKLFKLNENIFIFMNGTVSTKCFARIEKGCTLFGCIFDPCLLLPRFGQQTEVYRIPFTLNPR